MVEVRRSHVLLPGLGILLLLLALSCTRQDNRLAPLACPSGTRMESHLNSTRSGQIDLCRDPKTGFREGPYREASLNGRLIDEGTYRADRAEGEFRAYDSEGRLTHIIQFTNGEPGSGRLTRVGMDATFRMLNAEFEKKGDKTRMVAHDEETVEIISPATARFEDPAHDEPAMRERLVAQGAMCKPFAAYSNIQLVIARYVDDAGKDLLVVPIRRADCGK